MWANYDELMEKMPKPLRAAIKPAIFVPPAIDFTPLLDAVDEQKELERLNIVSKAA